MSRAGRAMWKISSSPTSLSPFHPTYILFGFNMKNSVYVSQLHNDTAISSWPSPVSSHELVKWALLYQCRNCRVSIKCTPLTLLKINYGCGNSHIRTTNSIPVIRRESCQIQWSPHWNSTPLCSEWNFTANTQLFFKKKKGFVASWGLNITDNH